MTLFTAYDYSVLHSLVFQEGYPGYRPKVVDINVQSGDKPVEANMRYAHVATKYLAKWGYVEQVRTLNEYLMRAHGEARRIAKALCVPARFMPRVDLGALRILEYPAGASISKHVDPNLFTIQCYRNQPNKFKTDDLSGLLHRISPGLHTGTILEVINGQKPTLHWAEPSETVQHSIVYFATPDWTEQLTSEQTVGQWLDEHIYAAQKVRT